MTQPPQGSLRAGCIIKNTWVLTKKLGVGAFGQLYLARSLTPNYPYHVAIKFEQSSLPKHFLPIETHALVQMQGLNYLLCFFLNYQAF